LGPEKRLAIPATGNPGKEAIREWAEGPLE
jgi:hypothetical protein